jgi:hypothetical protein
MINDNSSNSLKENYKNNVSGNDQDELNLNDIDITIGE